MQKEECGKMHEIIGDQILVNQALREGIQEYWLAHGIKHVLPDESMRSIEKIAPQKKVIPWSEGTWRLLGDERIEAGDQWAPLSAPDRWRPVNDSVGKMTSSFKRSRFRRLTIETDMKAIRPPGEDTGANLVGKRCWVWNDGSLSVIEATVTRFRDNKYWINSSSSFAHARIHSMGEPVLRPQHRYRDAGAALIRCRCRVWDDSSINYDTARAVVAVVSGFNGSHYTVKGGATYRHAQPFGDEPEPLPPLLLPVVHGEIPGNNGETVVGKRCYVWNNSPYARPTGIENAIVVTVTAFNEHDRFPYICEENIHQFARPVEFGHPALSRRESSVKHVGEYCKLTRDDGSFKFGVVAEETDFDVVCDGERFSSAEIITPGSLVGKRAICWDRYRAQALSGVVISENNGTFRTNAGVFTNASFDVMNQDPEEDSGACMVGVKCFVWDERFSSTRIGVISSFESDLYVTEINGEVRRFKHARPVSLGVR